MSPSTLNDVYAHSTRVVGRRIGDEFVLVPLAGRGADIEDILNLNKVGAFIWEQLDGARDGRRWWRLWSTASTWRGRKRRPTTCTS